MEFGKRIKRIVRRCPAKRIFARRNAIRLGDRFPNIFLDLLKWYLSAAPRIQADAKALNTCPQDSNLRLVWRPIDMDEVDERFPAPFIQRELPSAAHKLHLNSKLIRDWTLPDLDGRVLRR